jgi:hypothetical protein
MAYDRIVADDLAAQAARYPQLTNAGNVVRYHPLLAKGESRP